MTKENLIEIGLTEEQAATVMERLDGSFVPKTRFNEVNTELATVKTAIKERDTRIEGLEKTASDMEFLQNQNLLREKQYATEIKNLKLSHAVDKVLMAAKTKNIVAVKALLSAFLENAELSENGTVRGLDDEIKKLSEGRDTKIFFDTGIFQEYAVSGAAPSGTVTASPDPKLQGFETRLVQARKARDNLSAIKIKQEAAAQGILLM